MLALIRSASLILLVKQSLCSVYLQCLHFSRDYMFIVIDLVYSHATIQLIIFCV